MCVCVPPRCGSPRSGFLALLGTQALVYLAVLEFFGPTCWESELTDATSSPPYMSTFFSRSERKCNQSERGLRGVCHRDAFLVRLSQID